MNSDVRRVNKPGPDTVFLFFRRLNATPQSTPDQMEVFFRWLLANATATPAQTPKPEPPAVDQLLQHLVVDSGSAACTGGGDWIDGI